MFGLLLSTFYHYMLFSHDIGVYQDIAIKAQGSVGTGIIESEYPPLATALLYIINFNPFGLSFEVAWLLFILLIVGAGTLWIQSIASRRASLEFLGALLLSILFVGIHFVIGRNDIVLLVLLFVAWSSLRANSWRSFSCTLALAIAYKLTPVLLLPLLLFAPRESRKDLLIGFGSGALVACIISLATLGLQGTISNTTYMLEYHSERGVQVESTWSGVHMLWSNLRGEMSPIEVHHGAYHNEALQTKTTVLSTVLLSIMLLSIYVYAWRRRYEDLELDTVFLLVLLASVAIAPVFSPQYLSWFYPILLVWILHHGSRSSWDNSTLLLIVGAGIVGVASQFNGPARYDVFISQENIWLTTILNVRNLALILCAVLVGRTLKKA